jgi:heptosyltransferase III
MQRSILAIHPGALGDVVLFGHLLRGLGGGAATLVTGGEKGRLLQGLGVVGRSLDFDSLPMHEAFASGDLESCRLPALLGRHERLVSCFAAGNGSAQARLAALAGSARADFLPVRPPADFEGHLLDLWTRRLGLPPIGVPEAWPVPQAWREEATTLLRGAGVPTALPYVVIHPGAGAARKCWPLERFLEVARPGACRAGTPVLVLGPVEHERWGGTAKDLLRRLPLLLSPPLSGLAGVLALAAGFVGNDSGVSHLSAAVGTATVAIFQQPTDRHFAPRGRRVAIVSAPSLADIPADRVLSALESLAGTA